jgi:hypothetical protein
MINKLTVSTTELVAMVWNEFAGEENLRDETKDNAALATILTIIELKGQRSANKFDLDTANKAFDGVMNIISRNRDKGMDVTLNAYIKHMNGKGIFFAE